VKPISVSLSADDRMLARECAIRRVRDAVGLHARDRLGQDSEESHYWGALAEIAVSRHLGLSWSCSSMVWAVTDVAEYEVRSVPPGTRLYLKAKDNDPDDRRILLVAHVNGEVAMLMGWMTAAEIRRDGRREDWGNRGAPAYMLTSMAGLREVA
jgi:hypothetical protein